MGTGNYLRDEWLYRPTALHVVSIGQYSPNIAEGVKCLSGANFSSGGATALRVYYMPIAIPGRFTVARFMTANGSAASGNVDVGLYSAAGLKLISTGSTARSGTNVVQYIDVTNQSFPPGRYYLAMVVGSGSNNMMRVSAGTISNARMLGVLQETLGALPLPTTMTPVAIAQAELMWFGFTQSDTL